MEQFFEKKYPTCRVVYDRKAQATNWVAAPVVVEVGLRGRRVFLPTYVKVTKREWDARLSRVSVTVTGHEAMNSRIEGVLNRANGYITKLVLDGVAFDWDIFREDMSRQAEPKHETFIDFAAERIEKRNDICAGTKKNHRKLLNRLAEFNRDEKTWKIVRYTDLRPRNILAFDNWLHGLNYEQSTIHSYHKFLKIYINEAIKYELLDKSPYIGIHVSCGSPTVRKFLDDDELKKLMAYKPERRSMKKTKDLFLFQCFTGMAYSDMAAFRKEKIIEREGRLMVLDKRIKTAEPYYIILLPPVVEILERWRYRLPLLTNQTYNRDLKTLSRLVGIKAMTSHMARHTFAVMALNSGNSIEVVAKMMGHANIKTTQTYAILKNDRVEEGFEKLEKKFV